MIHNPLSTTVGEAAYYATVSKTSDLAPLGVDVGRTHAIATRVVLLLVVPKPLCHNALDLSLWLPLCCILEAWNTTASERYVQSALSVSMNTAR
jgi:hypothetical protein